MQHNNYPFSASAGSGEGSLFSVSFGGLWVIGSLFWVSVGELWVICFWVSLASIPLRRDAAPYWVWRFIVSSLRAFGLSLVLALVIGLGIGGALNSGVTQGL